MEDKRVEIVSDIDDIVTFDTIVRDTINRSDVAIAEERISVLEREIQEHKFPTALGKV